MLCANFVVENKNREIFCASFIIQNNIGKWFVQALYYKVVLGSVLCKLCSTK